MSYGDFPVDGKPGTENLLIPRGVILNRDLSTIHEMDLDAPDEIQEFVSHAWYNYSGGKNQGLHPYDGETEFAYDGPAPPYKHLDPDSAYSWLKSPRWKGKPMEVGPLARVLILYAAGHEPTKELANMALSQLDLPLEAMFSTMGRVAARTLETKIIADEMSTWMDNLMSNINAGDTRTQNADLWEPETWPKEAQGAGYMEAPRGALCHWIVIRDEKIANYQAVVPSTWNAGPRDPDGQAGPYEASLVGHDLADPEQPLEILRTIHSFDPCLACAVHVADKDSDSSVEVKVA